MATSDSFSSVACTVVAFAAIGWMGWKLWKAGERHAREFQAAEWREEGRCPACGYDLRGGQGRCPECGLSVSPEEDAVGDDSPHPSALDPHALRDDWPATPIEPHKPAPGERSVVVHSTRNRFELDLLTQQLQARGVWCQVKKKDTFEHAGGFELRFEDLLVMVPEGDEQWAREVIDRFRRRREA